MLGNINLESLDNDMTKMSVTLVYVLDESSSSFDIANLLRRDVDLVEDIVRGLLR